MRAMKTGSNAKGSNSSRWELRASIKAMAKRYHRQQAKEAVRER